MTKPIIALAVGIMAVDGSYSVDLATEVGRVFPSWQAGPSFDMWGEN